MIDFTDYTPYMTENETYGDFYIRSSTLGLNKDDDCDEECEYTTPVKKNYIINESELKRIEELQKSYKESCERRELYQKQHPIETALTNAFITILSPFSIFFL